MTNLTLTKLHYGKGKKDKVSKIKYTPSKKRLCEEFAQSENKNSIHEIAVWGEHYSDSNNSCTMYLAGSFCLVSKWIAFAKDVNHKATNLYNTMQKQAAELSGGEPSYENVIIGDVVLLNFNRTEFPNPSEK